LTPFDNIIGRTIKSIVRQDERENYEFFSPLGIYMQTSEQEGIYLGVLNDGTSVNVEQMNFEQLYELSGVEYFESFLNELRTEDELNSLIGEQITNVELAEYQSEELKGSNFMIKQGKYAGVRIRTTSNEFTFFNEFGGQFWMNMSCEIPNKQRWKWVKNQPQHGV
jgi:hypothetical protein